MQFIFTRHGESDANIQRIISNRDLPHALTAKGVGRPSNLLSGYRNYRSLQSTLAQFYVPNRPPRLWQKS